MRDDGTWHNELRDIDLKNPEVSTTHEKFKLELEIAKQCKAIRKKMGITQKDIALKTNSSMSSVSRLESCKNIKNSPSIATLNKYVQALNCHLEIKIIPNC